MNIEIVEYGDPEGIPLLYCHGSPGSHLEGMLLDQQLKADGIRLIAFNRRGFGMTPFDKTQTLLGEIRDVISVADELQLKQFAITGVSGGAATALGVAAFHPQRINFVASIGGWAPILELKELQNSLSPIDRFFFKISSMLPRVFRLAFSYVGYRTNKGEHSLTKLLNNSLSQTDKIYLQDNPEVRKMIYDDMKEAFASGARGPALDAHIRYKPWGFSLSSISILVHFYAGDDDRLVPKSFSEAAANATPNAKLTIFPGTGHFGLFEHFPQIAADLKHEVAK